MNGFQKQVRYQIKQGYTVEGTSGSSLLAFCSAKFFTEKNADTTVCLTVKGTVFHGRVKIRQNEGEDAYRVAFLKRGNAKGSGWFYHPVKHYLGVYPQQLTMVLDAFVNGTADVEVV